MTPRQVELHSCFRPGDLVRAEVIGLGDARSYYLSTAKNELGVVSAKSANGGKPMLMQHACAQACCRPAVWQAGASVVHVSRCPAGAAELAGDAVLGDQGRGEAEGGQDDHLNSQEPSSRHKATPNASGSPGSSSPISGHRTRQDCINNGRQHEV